MKSWLIKYIENEIISYLNDGKKVYLESGSINDEILSYEPSFDDDDMIFTTSACVFPKKIVLSCWDNVDSEDFKGNLFVSVW